MPIGTPDTAHWNDEEDWESLLLAIKLKQCTPFLGAGACYGTLPLGGAVAGAWADEYGYPFKDRCNLPKIAQYVAVSRGGNLPRMKILQAFQGKGPPDFTDKNEPHALVADFDLPIYVTTNYDDFLMKALARERPNRPKRTPTRLFCPWHLARQGKLPPQTGTLDPTPENPVVFHLHGHLGKPESMVLTEDDYLDFLMVISETRELIPPRIEDAFASSALLFLGYSLEDLNFRVLFRKLATYMQRAEGARHVSVQLGPSPDTQESPEEQVKRMEKQREYLERHYDLQKIKVYWGTCAEFAADLRARWEAVK